MALLVVLLTGCGLNSDELMAKNEALHIAKIDTFVIWKKMDTDAGCTLVLKGSQDFWVVTSNRADRDTCPALIPQDKVKVVFRDAAVFEPVTNTDTGDWLRFERLPTSPSSN